MKYGANVYCVYIEWKKTRVGLRDTVTFFPQIYFREMPRCVNPFRTHKAREEER